MFKKILAGILAGMLMASLTACGSPDSDTEQNTDTEQNVDSEGEVNKEKIYKLERADNDKITIELWYREDSEYVAQVSGAIYVPTGSTEYESMLADNATFDERVKAANVSEDIMHFSYDEVKLENGYVRCDFAFKELDADNSGSVVMIAEYLGLPASDNYFKLNECEQYLLDSGLMLDYEH